DAGRRYPALFRRHRPRTCPSRLRAAPVARGQPRRARRVGVAAAGGGPRRRGAARARGPGPGRVMPPAAPKSPALLRTRPVLVTGGAGFIGSNLADRLAAMGEHVLVFDSFARPGVAANVAWMKRRHAARVSVIRADIRDAAAVNEAVRDAQAVFHFAAQVAVTTSLVSPREDFDVNAGGTLLLLDALRRRQQPIVFASTNKVYGDLADL